jgi:hypothetical protein
VVQKTQSVLRTVFPGTDIRPVREKKKKILDAKPGSIAISNSNSSSGSDKGKEEMDENEETNPGAWSPMEFLFGDGLSGVDAPAHATIEVVPASVPSLRFMLKRQNPAAADGTQRVTLERINVLDERSDWKKSRTKDVTMLLQKMRRRESIGPCQLVAIIFCQEDGLLRVTRIPRHNEKVVCFAWTANPNGIYGGPRPLTRSYPDGTVGVLVVVTGFVLVDTSDYRVTAVENRHLLCQGTIIGTIIPDDNDDENGQQHLPPNIVYAKVTSLMDALKAGMVPSRYVDFLTSDGGEVEQFGHAASAIGHVDSVSHFRAVLFKKVLAKEMPWDSYSDAVTAMMGTAFLNFNKSAMLHLSEWGADPFAVQVARMFCGLQA